MQGRAVAVPLLLITLGVLFFAINVGLLPWDIWQALANLWPLILIVIGIDLFLGGWRPWLSAFVIVALILLVFGALFVTPWREFVTGTGTIDTAHVERELGSLQRAQVELDFGAGRLQVDSLGPDSPLLMTGDLEYFGQQPEVELREIGSGLGGLTVTPSLTRRFWIDRMGGQPLSWRVNLSQRIPIELVVKTGASDTEINLGQLRVEDLRLDAGASRTTVRFPQAGKTSARVSAGAADLTLEIPKQMAARIRVEQGLSSVHIDESRFRRAGDAYITEGFDQAANRLDLEVRAGVASVRIE